MTAPPLADRFAAKALVVLGFLIALGGMLTLGVQVAVYLRSGVWHPLSSVDLIALVPNLALWASYPTQWVGLHALLDKVPLSGLLLAAGIGLAVAADD